MLNNSTSNQYSSQKIKIVSIICIAMSFIIMIILLSTDSSDIKKSEVIYHPPKLITKYDVPPPPPTLRNQNISDEIINQHSIITSNLLGKFDEGYSEVCLQELTNNNLLVRTCLLDSTWNVTKNDEFYIHMETKNFCVYRQFSEYGYEDKGYFYDSKLNAADFGDTPCGEYMLLKWEKIPWEMNEITINNKNYYYLLCRDCYLR